MTSRTVRAPRRVRGEITVPGDKSISHRALLIAALAEGRSELSGRAPGEDQQSMVRCLEALGVEIVDGGRATTVVGLGLRGLQAPHQDLDCGNSGNTIRFLAGALAATPGISARLVGDASLSRRPMQRVAVPLVALGADVTTAPGGTPPVVVRGRRLRGGRVTIEVPSAQVKTAVLLAALQADGVTTVTEPAATRDHTERILRALGVELVSGDAITLTPPPRLAPCNIDIPGDPSAAAFFAVLGAVHPDAELLVRGVCLNPGRTGFLAVLQRMGANVMVENRREAGGEEVGDLHVRSSTLRGVETRAEEVPSLVDEVPVLAVAASMATGQSRFRGLGELRHKEVDRLEAVRAQLTEIGAEVAVEGDDLVVAGGGRLRGAHVASLGDHRMAMALAVAGCIASGETVISGPGAAAVSYPAFFDELGSLLED